MTVKAFKNFLNEDEMTVLGGKLKTLTGFKLFFDPKMNVYYIKMSGVSRWQITPQILDKLSKMNVSFTITKNRLEFALDK